jgi:hypothetical protein
MGQPDSDSGLSNNNFFIGDSGTSGGYGDPIFNITSGNLVGIGTTNPDSVLHISSSGTTFQEKSFQVNEGLTVFKSGNVSIGASDYDYQALSIYDSVESGSTKIYVRNGYVSASALTETSVLQFGFNAGASAIICGKDDDWSVAGNRDSYLAFTNKFANTENEHMRITSTGNIGVGLTNPT